MSDIVAWIRQQPENAYDYRRLQQAADEIERLRTLLMEARQYALRAEMANKYREGYDNALAEQPFNRNAVIEECAQVAENWPDRIEGRGIAAAIRALEEKGMTLTSRQEPHHSSLRWKVESLEAEIKRLRARNAEHEARYEALEALGLRYGRNAVIGECAQVAKDWLKRYGYNDDKFALVAAIRRLKEK